MTDTVTLNNGTDVPVGCIITSWYGQYGPDAVIVTCNGWGFTGSSRPDIAPVDEALIHYCRERLISIGGGAQAPVERAWQHAGHVWIKSRDTNHGPVTEEDVTEWVYDLCDHAESWLNDQLPEGFCALWEDGEFYITDDMTLRDGPDE